MMGLHTTMYFYSLKYLFFIQQQLGQQEIEVEEAFSEIEEEDQSQVQQKLNTRFTKSAKKLDPNDPDYKERLQRREERIKKMKSQTRWLADSAFTTYFGKPAWGIYGKGNVKPTVGGVIYGQHMQHNLIIKHMIRLTHNVQPHRDGNQPYYPQSYNNALRYGQNVAEVIPDPPRMCKEEDRLNPQQLEALKTRSPLTSIPYEDVKKTITDSKGQMKVAPLTIRKPNLLNSMRFASEAGSAQAEPIDPQTVKPTTKKQPAQSKVKRPSSAAPSRKQQKPLEESNREQQKVPGQKRVQIATQSDKKKDMEDKKKELDDSLTLPDKSQRKFMDELRKKKEKSQRLTAKVNEVDPKYQVQNLQQPVAAKPSQDLQEVRSMDDMQDEYIKKYFFKRHPSVDYLASLDPVERNPKYYKHIPPDWLHRIPYAGKTKQKGLAASECLDFGY